MKEIIVRSRSFALAAAAAAATLPALAAPASAAGSDSAVSVLHAVPGVTVDVYANGKPLVTSFEPGTLTPEKMLPAGTYDLKVVAAGDGADGKALIEADDVTVPAGKNITVVAHLSADGTPGLTPFVNDTSAKPAGKGELTVRHVAAAPAVDVRADGAVAFSNVVNPKSVNATLPAGTISADVVLAGTSTVAIGPAEVPVKAGTNTIVYAWGSAKDKTLDLAVQTVKTGQQAPAGVPAGVEPHDSSASTLALTGAGALAGVGAWAVAARRKRARA